MRSGRPGHPEAPEAAQVSARTSAVGDAARSRSWLWYSQMFVGLGCIMGWPPTRTLACSLAMGGSPFTLLALRGSSEEPIRATWSSLRGRDPIELEVELRGNYRALFEARDGSRIDLTESGFRALNRPGLARLGAHAAVTRVQQLCGLYGTWGFKPAGREAPADHLTPELHFVGHLLEAGARGGDKGEEAARQLAEFLDEHLMAWLPALRGEVGARPEGGFYAAVLSMAEANARSLQRGLVRLERRAAARAVVGGGTEAPAG